jgi:dTDP-4-amino-4,6-dideoxygalactose transaminase
MGPAVEKFEADLRALAGSQFAIAVSSGSSALHCAYAAIGIEKGDEVITSPMTFASTAATAMNLGATVVFADIERATGNIDPNAVESLITRRTKAIVAIDYAGHPADMDRIMAIGRKHGIPVIEDAAHSIGSRYKSRPVGSLADITTFSFFPTKNVTTGEGGAVVTDNPDFAVKARRFRSHGMVREPALLRNANEGPWHQEVHTLGLNYRLPDILATLGSQQIAKLERFKVKRARVFDWYRESLEGIPNLTLPRKLDYADPMWHLYPLRVPAADRRSIFERLRSQGIMVQVNYIPVHWHPVFQDMGYRKGLAPNAELFYSEEISMPMHASLSRRQIKSVVSSTQRALVEGRPS